MIAYIGLSRRDPLRYRRILANARAWQRRYRARKALAMQAPAPTYYELRFVTDNGRYGLTKWAAAVMRQD